MKKIAILGSPDMIGMIGRLAQSNLEEFQLMPLDMEPKIKTAKELKIKAVEQTEQIEESIINDPEQSPVHRYTSNTIQKTKKQKTARAANKRAKKARKINRK